MRADTLASLVRSARKLSGNSTLRAQQLVDLGEDEPIPATRDQRLRADYGAPDFRHAFPDGVRQSATARRCLAYAARS